MIGPGRLLQTLVQLVGDFLTVIVAIGDSFASHCETIMEPFWGIVKAGMSSRFRVSQRWTSGTSLSLAQAFTPGGGSTIAHFFLLAAFRPPVGDRRRSRSPRPREGAEKKEIVVDGSVPQA